MSKLASFRLFRLAHEEDLRKKKAFLSIFEVTCEKTLKEENNLKWQGRGTKGAKKKNFSEAGNWDLVKEDNWA